MEHNIEHWRYRHNAAIHDPEALSGEVGIVLLRHAITQYIREAEETTGKPSPAIGAWRDPVLGPAIGAILSAFLTLLNGELGRLDAGTLDTWARGMAERIGYSLDTETMTGQ